MANFPKTDLPENFPAEIELRLQVPKTLGLYHAQVEDWNYFYAISHKAIALGARQLENPLLENAVSLGATAFEIVGGIVEPTATYAGTVDNAKVIVGANRFLEGINTVDDFVTRCEYARERMEDDTPLLAGTIGEIVGAYTRPDKVAYRLALGGAGIARSMQLYVDYRLEAATETEDTSSLEES
jgi:hypothetical protein